jgi:hypothetical protein
MTIWRINPQNTVHTLNALTSEGWEQLRRLNTKLPFLGEWSQLDLKIMVTGQHPDDETTFAGDIYFGFGLPRVPILNKRAYETLQSMLKNQVESYACRIVGEDSQYHALNVVHRLHNCIEFAAATDVAYWRGTENIKHVRPLVLKESQVNGHDIFLIAEWIGAEVFVSDAFKTAVENSGLTGINFREIKTI